MNKGITNVDGKFYLKCKVVMLPTEKASKIILNLKTKSLSYGREISEEFVRYGEELQHLYILSDEEIKEGQWRLNLETNSFIKVYYYDAIDCKLNPKKFKKIIATTDPELKIDIQRDAFVETNCPLPRPSDAFLKAYCEKGGISEILVEYEYFENDTSECIGMDSEPNGIPFNGFTLKVAPDNTITIKPVKDSWNKEEMSQVVKKALYDLAYSVKHHNGEVDKWIEQNL